MKLVILYGSQTGTAQDIAERVWRQAKSHGVSETALWPMDQFLLNPDVMENPEQTRFMFVCSTTGQGEVPDNMTKFWKFIMRRTVPADLFEAVKFSVIGLGDSSYEKYNFISKKLFKRIAQLGGDPDLDLCLCDDQDADGIESKFPGWIQAYWKNWYSVAVDSVAMPLKDKSFILKYKTTILDSENDISTTKFEAGGPNVLATEDSPYMSRLIRNERATSNSHWQNTRLLEFDCANTKALEYAPGDVLMLRPSNLDTNVKKFYETFAHLGLERVKSKPLKLELNYQGKDLLSVPVLLSGIGSGSAAIRTVGDLVERYFDLNGKPRMSFFEMLAELATDELEKGKLLEFCNATNDPEGLEELNNYCYRARRTIIEVLCDFPKTCQNITSLDILLELIPSISPRAFSIASSPHVQKDCIQLLVAVVEYKTRLVETRKGTCSYWLNTLDPLSADIRVPVWIKKGSFSIEWSRPLICIGPGTGVAPMRSILNHRIVHLNQNLDNCLYFGCRSVEADFYFKDEWEKYQENSHLELNVAFSQQHADKKVYVQDLMLERGARVFELLDKREACVLIAGSSGRMPKDVLAILGKIVRQYLVTGEGEDIDQMADAYIKRLESQKRIQLETWS